MAKKINIPQMIFVLALSVALLSLLVFFGYRGYKQQTAFGVSADGYYALADSPNALTQGIATPATDCIDGAGNCKGVILDSKYYEAKYDTSFVSDFIARTCGASGNIGIQKDVCLYGTQSLDYQGHVRGDTVTDSYIKVKKDLYGLNFRTELVVGNRIVGSKAYISSLIVHYGNAQFTVDNSALVTAIGIQGLNVVQASTSVDLLLSFEPSISNPNIINLYINGLPYGILPDNTLCRLSSLETSSACQKITIAQQPTYFYVNNNGNGDFALKNTRYKLQFSCTIQPNEVVVDECVYGGDTGVTLGVKVDKDTLGLKYPFEKFCRGTPNLWLSTSRGGMESTFEQYEILVSGESFFIPAGDMVCFYYTVDQSLLPSKALACSNAYSLNTGACVGFVQTCRDIDVETKECRTAINYVNMTEYKTITEWIDRVVQCQTDLDCVEFVTCPEQTATCNILTNKCERVGSCPREFEYVTLYDTIEVQVPVEVIKEIETIKTVYVPVNVTVEKIIERVRDCKTDPSSDLEELGYVCDESGLYTKIVATSDEETAKNVIATKTDCTTKPNTIIEQAGYACNALSGKYEIGAKEPEAKPIADTYKTIEKPIFSRNAWILIIGEGLLLVIMVIALVLSRQKKYKG